MSEFLDKVAGRLSEQSNRLNGLLFCISTLSLLAMCAPTVIDVVSRMAFSRSVPGAIELVEFSLVTMVFAGFGYVQDRRAHIRVTLLTEHLNPAVGKLMDMVACIASSLLVCLMAWSLFKLGLGRFDSNEASPQLAIPLYGFTFFACIGLLFLAFSLVANAMELIAASVREKQGYLIVLALLVSVGLAVLPFLCRDTAFSENLFAFGLSGMAFLMVLILLGVPMGYAMTLVGFIGMISIYPSLTPPMEMLGRAAYSTSATYTFSVVPMFVLMGELAKHSGISRDLFTACSVWLGRTPGGMLVASIGGCAGFAAVAGDSMATAVTMGSVALPEMKKKGYDSATACGALAAGGTLGILIPPSTGFIFYALVTETSIGQLFMAGVVPGLVLTGLFMTYAVFLAMRHPELAPAGQRYTLEEKLRASLGIFPMLGLILLVLGGILAGWFSPNEGGAVGAAGTMFYAAVRRRLTWATFMESLRSSAQVTATCLLILIGVGLLGYFFAATGLPYELADIVVGWDTNRYVILLGVVILYLILGCMLSVTPMILLTLPAIFPSIMALGFDPVWFGVCVVILMECGQITPPVGINVFAMSIMVSEIPMAAIFRRIVPYFFLMLFMVLLLAIFPQLALWLPGILF